MIVLDTNYLIRGLVARTQEAEQIDGWLEAGEELCTTSIAWYEFLSGPVDEEGVDIMLSVIQDRVLPFVSDTAAEAARLFNLAGRPRRLRVDAMIAATVLLTGSRLATSNARDFRAFEPEGLSLVPTPNEPS
ncbi:MAG: type II toxin-antitoxin system VapC family toxin [Spirochaetaceae bacterium]